VLAAALLAGTLPTQIPQLDLTGLGVAAVTVVIVLWAYRLERKRADEATAALVELTRATTVALSDHAAVSRSTAEAVDRLTDEIRRSEHR
jgi:hypothetical protein